MEALLRAGVGPRALEQARGRSHLALARAAAGLACGRTAAALAVGGAAVRTWPGAPFNQALGRGGAGAPPAPELDAVEAFFRARDEACAIDLADQAPGAWRDLLRDRGYRLRASHYLWVRPLEDGDRRAMDPRVAPVANAAEREAWANAVAGGFADGAALRARDLDVARAICAAPAAELSLARDATGAGVAGGALQVDGAVAAWTRPRPCRRPGARTCSAPSSRPAWPGPGPGRAARGSPRSRPTRRAARAETSSAWAFASPTRPGA